MNKSPTSLKITEKNLKIEIQKILGGAFWIPF